MEIPTKIDVNPDKLEILSQQCWCSYETPILAVSTDFKINSEDYITGYLMITRGAMYFYRLKLFGKIEFIDKFSFLKIEFLNILPNLIVFEFYNKTKISIKTDDVELYSSIILQIIYEATYGNYDIPICKVRASLLIPSVKVLSHPKYSLRYKILMYAHYYNIKGECLSSIEYFNKWEENPHDYLIITPTFHPGNFALAFGHAIGLELRLKSIMFLLFNSTKFQFFLRSLMENAYSIKQIGFKNYTQETFPTFNFQIQKTSINEWWFVNCTENIILSFSKESAQLPLNSVNHLILQKCNISENGFETLIQNFQKSPCLNQVQHFELKHFDNFSIQFNMFSKLILTMNNLEILILKNIPNIDCSLIFNYIFKTTTNIKILILKKMSFQKAINSNLIIPEKLVNIDISNSRFLTYKSFVTFFQFITHKMSYEVDLFLQANNLTYKPKSFLKMSQISFDECSSNILELEFNNNFIPKEIQLYYFAYLFTQKKLRFLSLIDNQIDDETEFLQNVIQLCKSLKIPGLDISGNFDKTLFSYFIDAISTVPTIKRLGIRKSKSDEEGLHSFMLLLQNHPEIQEVLCDGFKTTNRELLYNCWKLISQHPGIRSCDLPIEDFKFLKTNINNLSKENHKYFSFIKSKPRPTAFYQRIQYLFRQIKENRKIDVSSNIFSLANSLEDYKNETIKNFI